MSKDLLNQVLEDISEAKSLLASILEDEIPSEPIIELKQGTVLYIRNDLDGATDNEKYALDEWGKGKYFTVASLEENE